MIHTMKLQPVPFGKIATGKKVIESRLFDEKRKLIRIGDEIVISRSDDSSIMITVKVTDLYRHDSFEELFSRFEPELFGGSSKEFLLEEIGQFYPKEEQGKYGVVGIRMELSKDFRISEELSAKS